MWSTMIAAFLSSKAAIGSTAVALVLSGGALAETSGLGTDVRGAVGLVARAESDQRLEAATSSAIDPAGAPDLASPASIWAAAVIDHEVASHIQLESNGAGDGAASVDARVDAALGPVVVGSLAETGVRAEGNARLDGAVQLVRPTRHGAASADASAVVPMGSSGWNTEAAASAEARPAGSYEAVLELARDLVGVVAVDACTESTVRATTRLINKLVETEFAADAALEACAEFEVELARRFSGGASFDLVTGGSVGLR